MSSITDTPIPAIVGVISDTHGVLRPQALDALTGCQAIVHAGDIGSPVILEALARLAPLTVVRGNVDRDGWTDSIPETASLIVGNVRVLVLHDIAHLAIDPAASGYRVVIHGHSHKPGIRWQDGVLYLNPGSAGRRRFSLPISLARLRLGSEDPAVELLTLDSGKRGGRRLPARLLVARTTVNARRLGSGIRVPQRVTVRSWTMW